MAITVKYNTDTDFRKKVAWRRMYRSGNFRLRAIIEMCVAAISAIAAVVIWYSGSAHQASLLSFYGCAVLAVFLIVRFIRSLLVMKRVKPIDVNREPRQFHFMDEGFNFGPVDEAGTMLDTRWRDIDNVYFVDNVIYVLCMGKRHWAAIDEGLITEGTAGEIKDLLVKNLPRKRITGNSMRRISE